VAATFPKGVLQQPSQLQLSDHWANDNLALLTSFLGVVGIGFYVGWLSFYGTARPPGAIVPQFAPPNGFSPAMVGYLRDKGLSDRDFSAGIVGLAVARHLKLIHSDGVYRLVRQEGGEPVTDLETQFEGALFRADDELGIFPANNIRIRAARVVLDGVLRRAVMPALLYREPGNVRPTVLFAVGMIVLTVAALAVEFGTFAAVLAFKIGIAVVGAPLVVSAIADQPWGANKAGRMERAAKAKQQLLAIAARRRVGKTAANYENLDEFLQGGAALAKPSGGRIRWTLAVVGLALLAIGLLVANATGFWLFLIALFAAATAALARASYLRLSVPTAEGWKRRDEIEGLKLFLGVAEADRLRVLNPPDFTPALYESYCPTRLPSESRWYGAGASPPRWPLRRSNTSRIGTTGANPGTGRTSPISARIWAAACRRRLPPPRRRRARAAVGPAAATAAAVTGAGAAAVRAGNAVRRLIHYRHSAPPFGDDAPIPGSRLPHAIRRQEAHGRRRGLDRIGSGLQLRDLRRDIAALDQLGVTLNHLKRGLLALPPEADIELVLTDAEVLHG
jgi:hypothetical protein